MKAGAFNLDEAPPEEPGMLMTSMIDVIFILLAFFVCVTELKKGTLDVDVPEVPTMESDPTDVPDPLVVEVTADDRVFVGGEEVNEEALAKILGDAVAKRGSDLPVHLSGDRNARNGTMMRIVSQLSKAGVSKIEFAVQAGG